jgi:hypothetical protein
VPAIRTYNGLCASYLPFSLPLTAALSFYLFTFTISFWFTSYSFTGSCSIMFKVIYHSSQTSVLCLTFYSFQQ